MTTDAVTKTMLNLAVPDGPPMPNSTLRDPSQGHTFKVNNKIKCAKLTGSGIIIIFMQKKPLMIMIMQSEYKCASYCIDIIKFIGTVNKNVIKRRNKV